MSEKKGFNIFGAIASIVSLVVLVLVATMFSKLNTQDNSAKLVLITFDLNDGRDQFKQSVEYDTKITKPEDPTREGYDFDGWYTNGEKWSFIGYTATSDTLLKANWVPKQYTITYDLNDDDTSFKATNNALNPFTYTIEDEIVFERPERGNSTFIGWSMSSIPKGTIGDLTITASWSVEYFINFDANGGDAIGSFVTGKGVSVTLPVPVRGSDTFLGWFDGTNYLETTSEFSRDANLFAIWKEDFDSTDNGDGTITVTSYLGESQTVVLPKNTKAVADNAFINKTTVTSIFVPEGTKNIGEAAFKGCISLKNIDLPNSIEDIDDYVFDGCSAIEYNEYDNGLYLGNSSNEYLWLIKANNTSIPYCNIHETTKHVYIDAFYGCSNLARIYIPNGVETIGEYAFYDCRNLKDVAIPTSVKKIGAFAFYKCILLNKVKTMDLVSWCNIEFGDSYSNPTYYAGDLYLSTTLVTNLTIPSGVTKIGQYAFFNCKSITKVNIATTVTSIGTEAFGNCIALTNVSLPQEVSSLSDSTFSGCIALKYYDSGRCLYLGTSTNNYVWLIRVNSTSIDDCVINKATKHILPSAFDGCDALEDLFFDGKMADCLAIIGDMRFNYPIQCDDGTITKK